MLPHGRRILAIQICCTILSLIGIGALMTACTSVPETKYEWLSLFFDGVPDPNAPDTQALAAQQDAGIETGEGSDRTSTTLVSSVTYHEPYGQRECKSCHEGAFSPKLIVAKNELCFECHFQGEAREELTHAPALSGDCWVCHHPHRTNTKHLLIEEEPALCQRCHIRADEAPAHAVPEFEMYSCTQCHHPHGNDQSGYIRLPGSTGTL